jgi:hypothetical protein
MTLIIKLYSFNEDLGNRKEDSLGQEFATRQHEKKLTVE